MSDFLKWGDDPHNPISGRINGRPAFDQFAYERYKRGEVNANGDVIKPIQTCHKQRDGECNYKECPRIGAFTALCPLEKGCDDE